MPAWDGGIAAQSQKQPNIDASHGLGDFQRRSNRAERDYHRSGNRRVQRDDQQRRSVPPRGWEDATPRATPREGREDAPSVRVPNVAWDSTPRNQGSGDGWGAARDRRWDAPTPRTVRGGDDGDDAASVVGGREWEEEQVKLDRDWYMGSEGGAVSVTSR
jgi:pre-mRNA-splicing factor ATP-dependent RNA helicase DHX38/PRP16